MSAGSEKEPSNHPLKIPDVKPTTPTKRKLSTSPAAVLTASMKQQKTGASPPVSDDSMLGRRTGGCSALYLLKISGAPCMQVGQRAYHVCRKQSRTHARMHKIIFTTIGDVCK